MIPLDFLWFDGAAKSVVGLLTSLLHASNKHLQNQIALLLTILIFFIMIAHAL